MTGTAGVEATRARTATAYCFVLNGLIFASWVSRIPQVRHDLDLTNGELGRLLFLIAIGSLVTLPLTGSAVNRFGTGRVVATGAVLCTVGIVVASLGTTVVGNVWLVGAGALVYGVGTAGWDVAMNIEGAAVEQALGRTIMPRFHAAFSLGTVTGGLLGAGLVALDVPMAAHLGALVVLSLVVVWRATLVFLPEVEESHESGQSETLWQAWREPRTLLVGLMVLAFALTEGSANDWIALALVDGHDTSRAVGVLGYAGFVTSMTVGRLAGTRLLDRFGREPVLYATALMAGAGILLLVYGTGVLAVLGIVLWGLGASLGFPVGMSAAADDPRHAAVRVSVVSSIGYAAFLGGPPVLGYVADHVGTLRSLLVVLVVLVPSMLAIRAAREPVRA